MAHRDSLILGTLDHFSILVTLATMPHFSHYFILPNPRKIFSGVNGVE
jgi:hypothetical protein